VVAIEAGLTFDKAVAYVVTTMQGALVSELSYYLVQRRLGRSVGAALGLVAQRVRDRDVDRLTELVAQSHQYGLPMGRVLSAFAMDLRTRRRQEATERAQAAVVKLLFPMVLFILPAIFIIVLGPALAGAQGVLLGRDDSAVTQAMVRALQAQGTFTTVTVTATAPPAQAAPMTLWVQARYLDPAGQPSTSVSGGSPPSGASGVRVDAATLFAQPVLGALLGPSSA